MGILTSVEFYRGSPGKFDSRTLSRETLSRWTGHTTQRQTAPADEDGAGGASGNPESAAPPLPETGVGQGAQYISDAAKAAAPLINFRDLRPPFVTQRPSACVDLSGSGGKVMRRQIPQDAVYDFSKGKQSLPVVKPPGPGYCHASVLGPMLLPETNVRVIWDGGAEGTSVSDKCMSRILRNQSQAGIQDKSCPLRGMARMSPAQRFFSFAEGAQKSQGREVDILGELHLATADGEPLPGVTVRMVPGQIDDILVAAPDLDKLGFDSGAADVFVLHSAGLSIPRGTDIPMVPTRSMMVEDAVRVYLRGTVMLRPHESRRVSVQTNDTTTEVLTGWLRAEEDDSFRVPEGPIELTAAALNVLVHNPTDDWVELEQDKTVARVVGTSDEDEVRADALHQLDVEEYCNQNVCPDDDLWQAAGGIEKVVDAGRSHLSISDIWVGGRVGRREDERLRKVEVEVSSGAPIASLTSAATLAE